VQIVAPDLNVGFVYQGKLTPIYGRSPPVEQVLVVGQKFFLLCGGCTTSFQDLSSDGYCIHGWLIPTENISLAPKVVAEKELTES